MVSRIVAPGIGNSLLCHTSASLQRIWKGEQGRDWAVYSQVPRPSSVELGNLTGCTSGSRLLLNIFFPTVSKVWEVFNQKVTCKHWSKFHYCSALIAQPFTKSRIPSKMFQRTSAQVPRDICWWKMFWGNLSWKIFWGFSEEILEETFCGDNFLGKNLADGKGTCAEDVVGTFWWKGGL